MYVAARRIRPSANLRERRIVTNATLPNARDEWPFDDPPNVAVITVCQVMSGSAWIGYVSRDKDDGTWQFLPLSTVSPSEADAVVVALKEVVEIDATVIALSDLPPGWHAWRDRKAGPWHREEMLKGQR